MYMGIVAGINNSTSVDRKYLISMFLNPKQSTKYQITK